MTEKTESDLYSCLRCGFCLDFSWLGSLRMCPTYDVMGYESYGARGKVAIARAISEGKLKLNESVVKRFFSCTDCLACQSNCFKFVNLQGIFNSVKRNIILEDLMPKGFRKISESLDKFQNIYGKPQDKRWNWIPDKSRVGEKADVLYFVGCTSSYLRRRIASSTYKFLERAKVNFTILKDEVCCGHPQIVSGQVTAAREFMEHNIRAIEKNGVDRVVFSCPACYRSFKNDAAEMLGKELPFEAIHISELQAELVNKGKIRFGRLPKKVTFQDPCVLARHLQVYEQPRQVLENIPGLELVEMPRHGKDCYCCGGGGFLKMVFPKIADRIGMKRLEEALETGAEAIVSACPACQTNLLSAVVKRGERTNRVVDLSQLVLEALS